MPASASASGNRTWPPSGMRMQMQASHPLITLTTPCKLLYLNCNYALLYSTPLNLTSSCRLLVINNFRNNFVAFIISEIYLISYILIR